MPTRVSGIMPWYRCRSDPQMAPRVTLTISSLGCSKAGMSFSSTRILYGPRYTIARIAPPDTVNRHVQGWCTQRGLADPPRGKPFRVCDQALRAGARRRNHERRLFPPRQLMRISAVGQPLPMRRQCGLTVSKPIHGEPPWKCWRVLIQHRRIQHMSAPRKYEQEFRERAVRMYRERLAEPGESKRGARRHVGALLDLNPETLRNWAEERDRVESGRSPAPRSAESEEVRALRRRVAELERANEILKTSAAFFAQAELDRRLK